jgi:hypothetical protein
VAVLLVIGLEAAQGQADGATYTVCASGCTWSSVSQVNNAALRPGDTVLFAGGETFPGVLAPALSGTPSQPITYSSYGAGAADLPNGIYLANVSNLVLDRLLVDGGDWHALSHDRGIVTAAAPVAKGKKRPKPSGTSGIVVQDCVFRNVSQAILAMNPGDRNWVVRDNLMQDTGDSAVLVFDVRKSGAIGGSGWLFERNRILDTGLDYATLRYPLHGIYSIGSNMTFRDNVISGFENSGISLRSHDNVVEGNTISNGLIGVSFSPYDRQGGTTRIAYNTISGLHANGTAVQPYGIVVYRNSSFQKANPESFVVVNNTVADADGGIRVVDAQGRVTVRNNLVALDSTGNPVLQLDAIEPGWSEANDLWFRPGGGALWTVRFQSYPSLAGYQQGSGLGNGDLAADPELDPSLGLAAGSPAIDAGTASVPGVVYTPACDGAPYDYCGSAPDLGAHESTQPAIGARDYARSPAAWWASEKQ